MYETNCWRILANGARAVGIRAPQPTCLRFGQQDDGCVTPLRTHQERGSPVWHDGLLLAASTYSFFTESGRTSKALVGRGDWRGALIHVSTSQLQFDEDRSSYFGDISGAWPGVESKGHAFIQYGERVSRHQDQIVELGNGAHAFVADQRKRYMRIDCTGGEIIVTRADKVEFAQALVSRGIQRSKTHRSLSWLRYALETMDMRHLWPDKLQKRIEQLETATAASSRKR